MKGSRKIRKKKRRGYTDEQIQNRGAILVLVYFVYLLGILHLLKWLSNLGYNISMNLCGFLVLTPTIIMLPLAMIMLAWGGKYFR